MFGRYRLLGRIGEGGMAEVYRAVMTGPEGFERELVLKRILPKLSDTGDFKTMFIREAKISALLLHPNIVQIYEFGAAEGAYFIAMESVLGVTLREALTTLRKAERNMPYMIAAEITRQICVGLEYAHTLIGPDGAPLEIVHQDISPTNIMLAFTGTVKILDFGIARAASFAEEERKKGLIKGKVSYLSPEQINVKPFDCRADVFALGVVFHEMLTGRRLFQAKNDIGRMRQLLTQPISPPSGVNASIPRELDRIVMKALEIDPKQRYQSAAEMAADLERTLIAARHSSRELAKLLHELFVPSDEPVVVVEPDQDAKTIAVTGAGHTGTGTTGTSSGGAGTGTPGSGMTGSGSGRTGSSSGSGHRSGSGRATGSITATEQVTPGERTRNIPARPEADSLRLDKALRAERGRLQLVRWRARAKVAFTALAVGAVLGGAGYAVKHYWPVLFPPSPPPPVAANQTTPAQPAVVAPAPAPAKPVKKRKRKQTTDKQQGQPTGDEAPAAPATGESAGAAPAPAAGESP